MLKCVSHALLFSTVHCTIIGKFWCHILKLNSLINKTVLQFCPSSETFKSSKASFRKFQAWL